MFRQRTSSQKPGDDLLANFRQQFPEVAAVGSTGSAAVPARTATAGHAHADVAGPGPERSHSISHEAFRDQDPTPRASNDPWRFTPSLLDPGSFSFANFANQPPGYYTPTPGGTNTIYHPQAGDLHTPTLGIGMGLGTPLSMPNSEGAVHSGAGPMDMTAFHQGFHPQQFQQFNPFIQAPPPQPSFAPSSFMHHDTGYETMDQGSPMDSDHAEERIGSIEGNLQGQSPMVAFQARQFGMPMSVPLPASAEKFRFHAALNAPTAMIKHADEIPVTYLNKGQAYSLSIVDTTPTLPIVPGTRFRTFVRVSFEDEQQRQKPGVCWSLWKEGRGTNEAHQRGGKLQAVEYVEAGQPAEGDDKKTRIELETSSFDGFSVIWTPGVNGAVECNIAVRFNFLSTDFSHSKGVKGIPVRLCAKTQQLPADASPPGDNNAPEICYCKVKLFRDHGAERKLSNDVAHVRKTIDKLKQQIAQAESGMKDFGKRKRTGGSQMKAQNGQRPGKVHKHKRTWSMSSASSGGGGPRVPLEEDLHFKLQTLQDMFTSTRPVSVLYLRGEELDDPDLHPVSLPGESLELGKVESRESLAWRSERGSITGSSLVSPSPSSLSLHSQNSAGNKPQWQDYQIGGSSSGAASSEPPSRDPHSSGRPTKVRQVDEAGNLTGWIEALGVDATYRPPADRHPKPVACFYVALRRSSSTDTAGGQAVHQELHRAVYLMQRSARDLVARLAAKWRFDAARVVRTVHVVEPRGLEVEVDDDVVRQLPEGLDMTLEIVEVPSTTSTTATATAGAGGVESVKREWDAMALDDAPGEADLPSPDSAGTLGHVQNQHQQLAQGKMGPLELRLRY
ncbi:CP2 transcription factor-domain-containing protein [Corynascus novoguineensis]|uniref:CP2 transcription factor-domain-containing protein n=1 Tax=Corynascus novoguineensis TaxID=1126955 RepID=A0AAN7HIR9_9PEZI|nr:CP2 transcription factor-domain-containing protein [Corynascus novoguineensis]